MRFKPLIYLKKIALLVFVFTFTCSLYAQVNLNNGLIGHWPLNGTSNDVSGNNRNGQIIGNLTPAADRFGNANQALRFNGSSYIRVLDNGALSPEKFTISVWFQSTSDRIQTIIGKTKFSTEPRNEQLQLYINWPPTPGIGSVLVPLGAPCDLGHQFAESRIFTGAPLCRQRWYHMVVSFDGNEHKLYLDGELKSRRTTGFQRITSCIGDFQFGSWWNGDLQYFEGFMDDIRIYNRALNDQEVAVLGERQTEKPRYDFSYMQNVCNPLDVNFFYNGPGNNISWQFEIDKMGTGNRPVHRFSKNEIFPVTMVVQYDNCATNDTITKNVDLNRNINPFIIINTDTVICKGSSFQLNTVLYNDYCWADNGFIENLREASPIVTPTKDTVFYLNHIRPTENLVTNGNFSAGNTGFTTTYLYRNNNTTEGEYFVGSNPRTWNAALSACVQPNGLAGNMLLVNGVSEVNKVVWQQEIAVEQNRTYDFSLFITSLFPVNPALLQFAINGIIIGDSIAAGNTPCSWQKFNAIWNSGVNTKAIISIVNRNTAVQGNDFAIDDIAFRELIIDTDSVSVKVESGNLQITADTTVCQNTEVQLIALGAATYSWLPANGLSNTTINNPVAVVDTTITYSVIGQTPSGCLLEGEVTITANELPSGKISPAQIFICGKESIQMLAEGGAGYMWYPGLLFSDSTIANPIVTVDTATTLMVKITGTNGCAVQDSVNVEWASASLFDVFPQSASICPGDSIELIASGGNEYRWENSPFISNETEPRLFVRPTADTEFRVKIKNTNCKDSTVLSSFITIHPAPNIEITKSNDLDCYTPTTRLVASGGTSYRWEQTNALNNLTIPNPIASAKEPTTFKLFVTSDRGCVAADSILVDFINNGVLQIQGDTTSCENGQVQLNAQGAETFLWLPATGLNNAAIANPMATIVSNIQYKVSGTTVAGCVVEDSIVIAMLETPEIQLFPTALTVCGTDTLQLQASGGVKYQWSPGLNLSNPSIANPVAIVKAPVTYTVNVTHENGCVATDSIVINWREQPEYTIFPQNATVCKEDTILIFATGGDSYLWYQAVDSFNLSSPSLLVRPLENSMYQVRVINSECNDTSFLTSSIQVNEPPNLEVRKSGDVSCEQVNVQLVATGGVRYLWAPASDVSNANISNPVVKIATTTVFSVIAWDSIGCFSTDTISVRFINTGNFSLYQIPTAFTPNGDGLNDCIGINKWGSGINLEQFVIYNRWGQQVFAGSSSKLCWDGTVNGKLQPAGHYVYQLKASNACGIIERKGSFLLIR